MAKIYVLCYHEDIETESIVKASLTKRKLAKYLKDNSISLRENNAEIFKFYTIEEVELIE